MPVPPLSGLTRRRFHALAALGGSGLALGAWGPAQAQFRVEVTGVGLQQIPFAIAPFRLATGLPQDVPAIVRANLERSYQRLDDLLAEDQQEPTP